MGQDFRIINQSKQQYLNPFRMPSSARFPNLIMNEFMCKLVTWLVCSSSNRSYVHLQSKGYYSRKHMGAWYGDRVEIIGDYNEEDLCHKVGREYEDITTEALAMLFENDDELLEQFIQFIGQTEEWYYFRYLAEVGLLEQCPAKVTYCLNTHFGNQWKNRYYRERNM